MYKRWTSAYHFRWTPILTYTRRHLQLLDWFEENVDPVAFVENHSRVGVAIVAEDLRITVTRSCMMVESGLSGLPVSLLLPAIEGVFEVLQPKDTVLSFWSATATQDLGMADYNEERAHFASRLCGMGPVAIGYRPIDGSALVDFSSPQSKVQMEWGIVRSSELLDRLQNPHLGRVDRLNSESIEGNPSQGAVSQDDMPEVSVFTDITARRVLGGEVSSVSDVADLISRADRAAESIATSVTGNLVAGEGSKEETW